MKKLFNWFYFKIKSYLFFRKVHKTDYEKLIKTTLWQETHKSPRSTFNQELRKEFNNGIQ